MQTKIISSLGQGIKQVLKQWDQVTPHGEAWHFTIVATSTVVYHLQISPSIKIASTAGELPHYCFQLSVETTFQDPQRDV